MMSARTSTNVESPYTQSYFFANFLQARELLEAMAASQYAAAFALLNRMEPALALDLHLAPLLPDLTRLIRRRALQQHVRHALV